MRTMLDFAFFPDPVPSTVNGRKIEIINRYIGGGTPHVATDAEMDKALKQSGARYVLPNFVRVPPTTKDPVAEANWCADWAERHGQPHGTCIALDYETSTVQSYLSSFDATLVKRGYKCLVYGSRSFVMQLRAPSGGRWSATWNNVPHIDAGAVATQYGGDVTLNKPFDINVVLDSVPLWDITGEDMLTPDEITQVKNAVGGLFTTSGSAVRTALLLLMRRAVNLVLGGKDEDTAGVNSPAYKAIQTIVSTMIAPILNDESVLKQAIDANRIDPQLLVAAFKEALANQNITVDAEIDHAQLTEDFKTALQSLVLKTTYEGTAEFH